MRIDIMRDVIKYFSLASCDSHTFHSEFRADAGFLGELRRLSNITEDSVQWEQLIFEWGLLHHWSTPRWADHLIQISRAARWSAIYLPFAKKRKILQGNQRVSEPPYNLPTLIQPLIRALAPEDPTFC